MGKSLDDWPPKGITKDPLTYTPQAGFSEGGLVDWKWFDTNRITPRFAFGYGLSVRNSDRIGTLDR